MGDCPPGTKAPRTADVCGTQEQEGFRLVWCEVDQLCRFRAAEVYCTPSCKLGQPRK